MTQGVPGWDLDEISDTPNLAFHAQPNAQPNPPHQPIDLHYEVAELTWENGQLAMHSLGLPRPGTAAAVEAAAAKSPSKYGTWEKLQAGGTLESIVNQAGKPTPAVAAADDESIIPWFEPHKDALVPSSHQTISADEQPSGHAVPAAAAKLAASSSGSVPRKRNGGGRTPTSPSSPENTSFTELAFGDHDASSSRSRPSHRGKREMEKKKGMNQSRSSTATKRSRAAAVHNQSERKRRDRINQRIMTLQKLVPNSTKTDKASMLDEVIEYLKQLQAQIQFMSKMSSIPQMMLPVTMQQMQLSVMAKIGMGMGIGVMDMNAMVLAGHPACMPPVVHPSAAMTFFPNMAAAWDGSSDRLGTVCPAVVADPMAAFLASQTQPISLEAYNRMVALSQHLHQQTGPSISGS